MDEEGLARAVVRGLAETGIEGNFGSVSRSTAGDWPSLGISQWEGDRARALLLSIPGGENFTEMTYSGLLASGRLGGLSALLDSPAGRAAQEEILLADARRYVRTLSEIPLKNPVCVLYAALWCPTSERVVEIFLRNRADRGIEDLETLHALFREEYARAADVMEYEEGYRNRADVTYAWVRNNS